MGTEEMVLFVGVIGTMVLILVLIIWFVCTNNRRKLQGFGERVETTGTVLRIWKQTDYQPQGPHYEPWVIEYSYYDGSSLRQKSFESLNRKMVHKLQANDRIAVHFDRQNPDNAVTALQMETEKAMRWRLPLYFLIFFLIVAAIWVLLAWLVRQ